MEIENNLLISFIKTILPIKDTIAYSIAEHFEPTSFTKNDFLLNEGKIANDYLFLERGFIRSFTYDMDGNEVTTNLHSANSIVFEAASFIKRTPTKENIQALTDCTAWVLQYDTFQNLFHSIPEFREFARENLVNSFVSFKERTLAMINLSAEQRYENLLKTKPELIQNVPLKHIASYLGITDTSLSRIRKEITHK